MKFNLGKPYLDAHAIQVPGRDVYRVPAEPGDSDAVALSQQMGGRVPSAIIDVPMGKQPSEADLAQARRLIDQRVKDTINAQG